VLTESEKIADVGYIGAIPVRNLWLLMLYASDLYRELALDRRAIEDTPDEIPDLVAKILCHRVEYRLRRNLSYGYQTRQDILSRLRGHIDLLKTEQRHLLARGKIACVFAELTVNTARNRYVRAALAEIAKIVEDKTLAHRCRSLAAGVSRPGVSRACPGPETRRGGTHAGSTPTEWSASDNGVPWAAAQSRKEASGRRSVKGTSRSDTSPLLLSFMTYG